MVVNVADNFEHTSTLTAKATDKKEVEEFRNYDNSRYHTRVARHYKAMRENQTVAFYKRMEEKYSFEDGNCRARMTIREAFTCLENYIDSSDPDLGLPNLIHLLQTAEGIRKAGHPDWFQLVGLIHDMGKIMFMWGCQEDGQQGTAEGPQWALGGDTWVLGCRIPDSVVMPKLNELNPDMHDPRYSSKMGIHQAGCGIENVMMAWGHDEYMYRVLVANSTTIPREGLAIVRYHSAYPWHDKGEYKDLMAPGDDELMRWVKEFNRFDLYTKDEDNNLDVETLWPYYQTLIEKYLPNGPLRW